MYFNLILKYTKILKIYIQYTYLILYKLKKKNDFNTKYLVKLLLLMLRILGGNVFLYTEINFCTSIDDMGTYFI